MAKDTLEQIQRLQFTDRPAAEAMLLDFVREVFPALHSTAVELRPVATSLNSFNGFLTLADKRQLFFKTHVEPDSVVDEYYNSSLLANAGYPIISPLYASTEYGKQFLIYKRIDSPSVFDVAREVERGASEKLPALTAAQNHADEELFNIYLSTLDWQSAEEAAQAPVHQLFYHRLGERFQQYYAGNSFMLPGKGALDWEELFSRSWVINGVNFLRTPAEMIERARSILSPDREGWSIIGHGDAHNGNVFDTPKGFVYFDPAFAGQHSPLLDLAKPLFHNVFATWMYHPQEVAAKLAIKWVDDGKEIHVEHNYQPSAVRRMFFESKIQRVVKPLILEMSRQRPDMIHEWRSYLKAALMCCPLLTMNLADRERFPAEIGLLGLCFALEMGNESVGPKRSLIDRYLNKVDVGTNQ